MFNIVQPVAMTCTTCGAGPSHPRTRRADTREEIITEAVWTCGHCGSMFKKGIVERKPKDEK
jgi:uncharacterized Zn finger protein